MAWKSNVSHVWHEGSMWLMCNTRIHLTLANTSSGTLGHRLQQNNYSTTITEGTMWHKHRRWLRFSLPPRPQGTKSWATNRNLNFFPQEAANRSPEMRGALTTHPWKKKKKKEWVKLKNMTCLTPQLSLNLETNSLESGHGGGVVKIKSCHNSLAPSVPG